MAKLDPNSVDEVVQAILEVIDTLDDAEHRGGAFFIFKVLGLNRLEMMDKRIIGDPKPEKTMAYQGYAQEKAWRLVKHYFEDNHVSSWASRNVEAEEYGGAIIVTLDDEVFIFTFSGLPEKYDELCDLVAAQTTGFQAEVREIIRTSNNDVAEQYLAAT